MGVFFWFVFFHVKENEHSNEDFRNRCLPSLGGKPNDSPSHLEADQTNRISNLELPQIVKRQPNQAIPERRLHKALPRHEDIGEIKTESAVERQKTVVILSGQSQPIRIVETAELTVVLVHSQGSDMCLNPG